MLMLLVTNIYLRLFQTKKTNKHLKEICAAVGIEKKISFHSARHTFATCALELGINTEVLSKMLGHTELKTTLIYTHVSDNMKYKERNAFFGVFF